MLKQKHYQLIAHAICRVNATAPNSKDLAIKQLVHELSRELERDNPRFKPDRFYSDCGLEIPEQKKARR